MRRERGEGRREIQGRKVRIGTDDPSGIPDKITRT